MTPRAVALACALLAFGLCLCWFCLPGNLFGVAEYDAGVYFGVSLRLVDGIVPYRDYVFVHPPGIALLMAPLALLAKVVGAPVAFAASRVMTALVAGVDAGLAALLVRHRGRLAMAIAGAGLALFPYAWQVERDLKLGPYLVLLVLAGALVAQGEETPSRRRLVVAGVLLGLAGAVKIWAFFPFLALLACEVARSRRRAGWLVAGTVAGFGVPCLPFAALAPARFVREVVIDQLQRGGYDYAAISLPRRLGILSGVDAVAGSSVGTIVGSALFVALVLAVAWTLWARERGRALWSFRDSGVGAMAAVSVAGLLAAPGIYSYYSYFTAPFVAGVVAIVVSEQRRRRAATPGRRRGGGRLARTRCLAGLAVVAGLGFSLSFADLAAGAPPLGGGRLAPDGALIESGPAIARVVPAGTCVVADDPSLLIDAGRFAASQPGCPVTVDPFGTWMVDDHGRGGVGWPPLPPALVASWRSAFGVAGAVVLSAENRVMVPWTPGLHRYFDRHFRLVLTVPQASVYLRRRA